MRRFAIAIGLLAGCWRGGGPDPEPPSFVAQLDALADVERDVDGMQPQLQYAMQRIIGLASEAERDAIGEDLATLQRELARVSHYMAGQHDDKPAVVERIGHKVQRTVLAIATLREELRYAKTTAELEALDQLSRDGEERNSTRARLRAIAAELGLPEPAEELVPITGTRLNALPPPRRSEPVPIAVPIQIVGP